MAFGAKSNDGGIAAILKNTDINLIAAKKVEGASYDIKYFRNQSVGASYEMLTSNGGTTYPFFELAQGVSLEIASNSANDTVGGSGVGKATVYGLDLSWDVQSVEVALNGITYVPIPSTWARVYRVRAGDSGTYDDSILNGTNDGDLTVRIVGTGTVVEVVEATVGSTLTSVRPCPAGFTMYVKSFNFSAGQNDDIDIQVRVRPNANNIIAPFSASRTIFTFAGRNQNINTNYEGWYEVPEYSDLYAIAANNGGTPTKISGHYETVLINNSTFKIP